MAKAWFGKVVSGVRDRNGYESVGVILFPYLSGEPDKGRRADIVYEIPLKGNVKVAFFDLSNGGYFFTERPCEDLYLSSGMYLLLSEDDVNEASRDRELII